MKSKHDKKPVTKREYHELMQPLIDLRKRSLFALRQSTINQFVDAIFFAKSFCEVTDREIDGLDDFVAVVKKKAKLVKSGAIVAFTHDEYMALGELIDVMDVLISRFSFETLNKALWHSIERRLDL